MINIRFCRVLTALLTLSLVVACSKKEEAATGLLKYVPADTPYVVITQDKLPDDLYSKLEPHIDRMMSSYRDVIRAAVDSAEEEAEGDDAESMQKIDAIVAQIESLLSIEGLESAGIDRSSRFAFFGHGLLPVMRLTLTDGALLEAEIVKMEGRAAESMHQATIDGHSYRFVGDDEGRAILAIIDNQLVITFSPANFDESQLREILGLTLPEENIGDSGRLEALSRKYSFNDL